MNSQASSLRHAWLLCSLTLALSLATGAAAQQQPVTGQMMDGQQPGSGAMRAAAPVAAEAPSARANPAPAAPNDTTPAAAPTPPPPEPATAATPSYTSTSSTQPGDATRNLLQFQVDGSAAGKHLPMLGSEAGSSYRRYMDSFSHPIPEFYETAIQKSTDSGR